MFARHKKLMLAIGAVALVTAAMVVTTVLAQTPAPQGSQGQRMSYAQVFLSHLASRLGIDEARLRDAVKQAEKDTVGQALANGDLTKEQADRLNSRIDQGDGLLETFAGKLGRGHGHGKAGKAFGAAFHSDALKAAADKLGMSEQDLRAQLKAGKSLNDLAKEKNVPAQDVRNAVVAVAKARLDAAMTEGRLTQQQADRMVQELEQGRWMDMRFKAGGHGKSGGPGREKSKATPTPGA